MWWRRRRDEDFGREVQAHIDLEADRLIGEGFSAEEARAAAHRAFGNVTRTRERFYEARRPIWLDDLRQDVSYALRSFGRTPGFTSVAVLTLALGIGATTAIFSVVSGVLLRPLSFADADRLVQIVENIPADESFRGVAMRMSSMNPEEFDWWRARTGTLSHMAVTMPESRTMMTPDGTVRLAGARVSPAWFPTYGLPPRLGRWLQPDEERPDAAVVVIGSDTWRRYFGADPAIVGRAIVLDGRSYSVVGVMPPESGDAAFWTPFAVEPAARGAVTFVGVTARLAEGISLDAATAEANVLGRQLRGMPPVTPGAPPRFEVVRLREQMIGRVRPALRLLVLAVGVVLLIVCANVANLLLVRGAGRQSELDLRRALGARPGRLAQQLLTESVVLAVAGGTAGAALSAGGVHWLRTLAAYDLPRRFRSALGPAVLDRGVLPRLDEIAVDPQMLAFALGLSLLTGLLFGLAPALRLARVDRRARQDRASRPRHGDGPTRTRTGQRLTMAQLVLATTLLVGAGLLINSFVRLAWLDVGFDRHALSVQVVIPTEYSLPRKLALAYEARDRLAALPGISAVGFTDRPPLANSGFRGPVVPLGAEWLGMGQADMALLRFISPGVLPALGVRLLDGRELDARDAALRPYSLLVNRAYARRFFGDASPVGELVRWGTVGVFAVVGVVEDFRFQMPETALTSPAPRASEREPAVFMIATVIQPEDGADAFANAVSGDTVSFLVRTDGDPSALLPDLPGLLRQVDPALAVEEASTLGEVIDGLNTRPRFYAVTLGIFAAVAVFLAAVGIYGVLAHTVTQRTREIGIRMAVGARPNQVIGLILQEAVGMVAIGLVVGLAMAVAFTRALTGMLYGLSVLDPLTYGGVLAVLAAGALLASWVPARRATKVDPLVALRCE